MREGHRFRFLLAMNCQVAAVAAEGAEAPYSKAPAVLEYGAVLPTNFWGSVIICLSANWYKSLMSFESF
jgi:hypothetical protein